jgi:sorbitol-specific phosphotransferase system component IIC
LFENTGKAFTDFNTGIWTIFIVFLTADVGLSILLLYGSKTVRALIPIHQL